MKDDRMDEFLRKADEYFIYSQVMKEIEEEEQEDQMLDELDSDFDDDISMGVYNNYNYQPRTKIKTQKEIEQEIKQRKADKMNLIFIYIPLLFILICSPIITVWGLAVAGFEIFSENHDFILFFIITIIEIIIGIILAVRHYINKNEK